MTNDSNDLVKSPLEKLEAICAEIHARWDKDQRSGKLLAALAGTMPSYRRDVTDVRQALLAHQAGAGREDIQSSDGNTETGA